MIVTVFRSRLNPAAEAEYRQWAPRIGELARTMQGFISHKTFVADDGERVTIVEFENEEAQRAWARHPEHIAAQKKGRAEFYLEYSLQICEQRRESRRRRADAD